MKRMQRTNAARSPSASMRPPRSPVLFVKVYGQASKPHGAEFQLHQDNCVIIFVYPPFFKNFT
jgi:hypothetical protein